MKTKFKEALETLRHEFKLTGILFPKDAGHLNLTSIVTKNEAEAIETSIIILLELIISNQVNNGESKKITYISKMNRCDTLHLISHKLKSVLGDLKKYEIESNTDLFNKLTEVCGVRLGLFQVRASLSCGVIDSIMDDKYMFGDCMILSEYDRDIKNVSALEHRELLRRVRDFSKGKNISFIVTRATDDIDVFDVLDGNQYVQEVDNEFIVTKPADEDIGGYRVRLVKQRTPTPNSEKEWFVNPFNDVEHELNDLAMKEEFLWVDSKYPEGNVKRVKLDTIDAAPRPRVIKMGIVD